MGELVSHKYGRHFSRDSVFSAINLFGSTLFLDICMHQQHFVQRIFYHLYLVLPPAPNAHGGNDRTRGAVCGARSRRPRGASCSSYMASAPRPRSDRRFLPQPRSSYSSSPTPACSQRWIIAATVLSCSSWMMRGLFCRQRMKIRGRRWFESSRRDFPGWTDSIEVPGARF